jgi:hypothetical protein
MAWYDHTTIPCILSLLYRGFRGTWYDLRKVTIPSFFTQSDPILAPISIPLFFTHSRQNDRHAHPINQLWNHCISQCFQAWNPGLIRRRYSWDSSFPSTVQPGGKPISASTQVGFKCSFVALRPPSLSTTIVVRLFWVPFLPVSRR